MRSALPSVGLALLLTTSPTPATAQPRCARTVVFTLPGVTWSRVARARPPELLRVLEDGAAGSVSMRTNEARPSLGSAFTTIGAGARADGDGQVDEPRRPGPLVRHDLRIAQVERLSELAERAGYGARPGALGTALAGHGPVAALGNGDVLGAPNRLQRETALAAMDDEGHIDRAALGPSLLEKDARAPGGARTDPEKFLRAAESILAHPCATAIIDPGDLMRAEATGTGAGAALRATDDLLGDVRGLLREARDLLLVVAPTSPRASGTARLGIALALGPDFPAGSWLRSPSTRTPGLITLQDVAPTVLDSRGIERPATMLGRSLQAQETTSDRLAEAVALDRESVFAYASQPLLVTGFVVFQVVLYGAAAVAIRRRAQGPARALEAATLAAAAFPLATYLGAPLDGYAWGLGGMVAALIAIDAALVTILMMLPLTPLDRLLTAGLGLVVVLALDLATGGTLQLNALFGNYPLVGGRFAGIGNTGFALFGAATLVCGGLLVQRGNRSRSALGAAALLFLAAVVVDGAPGLGADVGGVVALAPCAGFTFVLLRGRRPGPRALLAIAGASLVVLVLFASIDLARPEGERTHLGRLLEAVSERGAEPVVDAVGRKLASNLAIFYLSPWSWAVPLVVGAVAVILWRWRGLAHAMPSLRSALLGTLLLGAVGTLVNDSGVVVAALVLVWVLPAAALAALELENGSAR